MLAFSHRLIVKSLRSEWVKEPIFLLLITALLLAGSAGPAAAQDDPITLTAEVGFENYYKKNEWTPVRVTVANSGPDVEGFIVVEQTGSSSSEVIRYQVPVSLPGQSRKTVTLYVGMDKYQTRMAVELVSHGRTLAEDRVRIIQVGETARLYAIASGEAVDMAVLERIAPPGETAYVAYITLDQLPAAGPAWDGLDLLVLNDVDTATLTPAQLSALRGWLAAGGHLVVTGGPNWRKTSAALDDLLPVSISGSASVYDLSALSELTGATISGEPFVVAQGTVADGRTLLASDNLPLLVRRDEGLGQVDWLALDLALAPLRDWAGNDELWSLILSDPGGRAPWDNSNGNIWAARDGLKSIPSLALPSALQMVLFLLVYTVLIGPVNYFILNRRKRRELAWITIPAIILLFSGLAYVTGFQIKGGNVVLNRLSLVYGAAGTSPEAGTGADSARARTLVGIFSPGRATFDVSFSKGVLVRPLTNDSYGGGIGSNNSAVVEQSNQFVLRDLQLDVGGLRAFRAESDVIPPAVSASLTIDTATTPRLTGSVTNGANFTLQSAGLLVGETVIELGDLVPGQTVSVNERLSNGRASRVATQNVSAASYGYMPPFPGYFPVDKLVGGTNYWNDKDLNRRYQILQAFAAPAEIGSPAAQNATFFGWSEQPLWAMEVADRESETLDTVGYFLELPLSLSLSQSRLVVPPALTTWQWVDGARPDESGPYDYYLINGWASFQYQPWEAFQLAEVDELVLNIDENYNQQAIRVALWDWSSKSWVVDESLDWGENHIRQPGPFIGPNNAVRVRIENLTSTGVTIRRMDVTFIGQPARTQGEGVAQ